MLVELALNIVVPIFKGMGDIRNCSCYIAVGILEHAMKVVERLFVKRLCRTVTVGEMQFGFMSEREATAAVLMLSGMRVL